MTSHGISLEPNVSVKSGVSGSTVTYLLQPDWAAIGNQIWSIAHQPSSYEVRHRKRVDEHVNDTYSACSTWCLSLSEHALPLYDRRRYHYRWEFYWAKVYSSCLKRSAFFRSKWNNRYEWCQFEYWLENYLCKYFSWRRRQKLVLSPSWMSERHWFAHLLNGYGCSGSIPAKGDN